jgi:hypothetical protein
MLDGQPCLALCVPLRIFGALRARAPAKRAETWGWGGWIGSRGHLPAVTRRQHCARFRTIPFWLGGFSDAEKGTGML